MLSAVRRGGNQSEALPNDRSSVPRVRSVKDSIGGSLTGIISDSYFQELGTKRWGSGRLAGECKQKERSHVDSRAIEVPDFF